MYIIAAIVFSVPYLLFAHYAKSKIDLTDEEIYQFDDYFNQKTKKNRGKPTKSPIPVPKDYKLQNYQKLFSNHHPVNNILKPKSAFPPRKNNFMNNVNNMNNNNLNKKLIN